MKKLSKILPLFLITTLLLLSCFSSDPEETFELIRERACEGDVEGFFSYFDKDSVERNYRKQAAERAFADQLNSDEASEIIYYRLLVLAIEYDFYPFQDETKEIITEVTTQMVEGMWETLTDDVERKDNSDYCTSEVYKVDKKNNRVTLKSWDNLYQTWTFKDDLFGSNLVSIYTQDLISAEEDSNSELAKDDTTSINESNDLADISTDNYDFRKTRWGMSLDEVKSSEDAEYLGTAEIEMKDEELDTTDKYDNTLVYEDNIGGLDVHLVYIFTNEKLSQAFYQYKNRYSDPDTYLINYNELVQALNKKYGEPSEIKEDWKNEKYKNDPEKLGKALREGHINLSTTWQTPDTELTIGFSYKTENVPMYTYYLSKHYDEKYERLVRHREEEKDKDAEKEIEDSEIEEKL